MEKQALLSLVNAFAHSYPRSPEWHCRPQSTCERCRLNSSNAFSVRVSSTKALYHAFMAHALLRSAGNLQRLAQASVASSVIASDWAQPAGITSLLAWHQRSTTDHRKLFSSDDKRDSQQSAAQAQAEASKQPGPEQGGLGSASSACAA